MKSQSSLGGKVAVIHVEGNQNVNKGQLLLTLKNDAQEGATDVIQSAELKVGKRRLITYFTNPILKSLSSAMREPD